MNFPSLAQAVADAEAAHDALRQQIAELTSERDAARDRITVSEADNVALRATVERLEDKIRELEKQIPRRRTAGALPWGTATYKVPEGAVSASPSQMLAVVHRTVPLGGFLVLEEGTHVVTSRMTLDRGVTLVARPGAKVTIDFRNEVQAGFVLKSRTQILGIRVINGGAIIDPGNPVNGIYAPSGADDSLIENCHFEDFAGSYPVDRRLTATALYVANNRGFTVRSCTFRRSGVCHIHSEKTVDLTVEDSAFFDANTSGQPSPQPLTAAMKHTRARNINIRRNHIEGIPTAMGIWLDVYCYLFSIVGNKVIGSTRTEDKICVELSGHGIIASNHLTEGPTKYSIRVLCSNHTRVFHNAVDYGSQIQIEVRDDGRRNANDIHKVEAPGEVSNVELVGNVHGPNFGYFQQGVWDSGTGRTGDQLVTRVESNVAVKWGWGRNKTQFQTRNAAEVDSTFPAIARNNANPQPVTLPEDIAVLAGGAGPFPPGPFLSVPELTVA